MVFDNADRGDNFSMAKYGSDVIAELLKAAGIEHVAVNPGSSFRGLHDSLVNRTAGPDLILACHEEIAVSIAHGYAKASGKPMAVVVHDIVGLQHASMAIYNAWCDRVPVMVLGATGPMDSTKRRPHGDWIHTALIQGNLIRDFVKFDDQPFCVTNVPESFLRAYKLMMTEPKAPVYLCYDISLQEDKLTDPIPVPPASRYGPPSPIQAEMSALQKAAKWLVDADNPVVVADCLGRNPGAVTSLIELAELLAIPVIDVGSRFNFPSIHDLDATGAEAELLPSADVILSLDARDILHPLIFSGLQTRGCTDITSPSCKVISVSLADLLVRSWSCDYQRLQATDLDICADTSVALPVLVDICREMKRKDGAQPVKYTERRARLTSLHHRIRSEWKEQAAKHWDHSPISVPRLCSEVWEVIRNDDWVLAHSSVLGWPRKLWDFSKPSQHLGLFPGAGGGGLGCGVGISMGVALAHKDDHRLCVDLQADGDFLYTSSSLWTAAHHKIPLLVVMFNNRSYYISEAHASAIARERGRPEKNAGIGTKLNEPPVDYAQLARSFGVYGEGPIDNPGDLRAALERAAKVVREGSPALVDVITQPR